MHHVATSEDPPYETNCSGMPVVGMPPPFIATFTSAWAAMLRMRSRTSIAPPRSRASRARAGARAPGKAESARKNATAAHRPAAVARVARERERPRDEEAVKREEDRDAREPPLLGKGREDEVRVPHGEEAEPALRAALPALAENAAGDRKSVV